MSGNAHIAVRRAAATAQPAVFVAAWLLAAIPAQPGLGVYVVDEDEIGVGSTPVTREALLAIVAGVLTEVRFAGWRIAGAGDSKSEPYPGGHDDQLHGNA